MIPEERLSSEVVSEQFVFPRNIPRAPLLDYEFGGVAIADASRGLRFQVWRGEYIETRFVLSAPTVPEFDALAVANVDSFGFTFDQNMTPFFTYELTNGNCFFRWFDGTLPGFVTTQLPTGTRSPLCCLDDNRDQQIGVSDIILAYCRGTSLYFRAQRERFAEEHELTDDIGPARLLQVGMNRAFRMQFKLTAVPQGLDSPGPGG